MVPAAFGDPLLEIRIAPRVTGYPTAFKVLLAGFGLLCLGVAVAFALNGAFPVLGFAGLELVALFVLLRVSFRRASTEEALSLSGDTTVVRRSRVRGQAEITRLQSYWLRIEDGARGLVLRSRGQSVALGAGLDRPQIAELAAALRGALHRVRTMPMA